MKQKTHAIVIGGGIAGLVAARVLTNHFDQVTILERDHYPETPVFRPGVPQGRQVHTMLLKGQQLLESLFPGISAKLYAQGAVEQLYGHKSLYIYKGRRCLQIPPLLRGWNCSRILLEWQIRHYVQALSQVHILEGVEVIHLLPGQQPNTIRGVQFRKRGPTKGDIHELEGALVVDASGAASRAVQWLEELGYEPPQETIVDAHIGYATQVYEPPINFQAEWTGIAIQARDNTCRGGILMRVEGERWMVGFSGTREEYPSTNEEEYRTFAQKLPDPVIYEAIKDAKPLSPIYGYRRTENRLRHFERLKRFPDNLIIMGDAKCMLNPVYGQGMTIAVLEALVLDTCLKQYRTKKRQKGFSRAFRHQVARTIRTPWILASSGDAPQKEKQGLADQYVDRIFDLLTKDQKTLLVFLEVLHMLRSPFALLHPGIITKVLTTRK
ncbi:FAD-dependent oxidoreductase [Ktedonobacter racemifer]|uniref:FAD dependent oxidoreductase n=1 Tax=Ktedonobacter racemifer DSM 44963 TaxID=485913 RepID=D6TWY4_KTERA|nr:FAD-dependent monooxygenase [Ktedonobacter racemifer]EFH84717.1 FAD dependent oxidoreductase [Ktedonobacter racemifer DSM 44963]